MSVVISHNVLKEKVRNALKGINLSWEYEELIYEVISRIDNLNEADEDTLLETCDDTIIYYEDMWTILKENCWPNEANWAKAYEIFIDHCLAVLEAIK